MILKVTRREPTPILEDFITYTTYLVNNRIELTEKKEVLPPKVLFELNQMMNFSVKDADLKFSQKYYPLLTLFFHIVTNGKLFEKSYKKGGRKIYLEPTDKLSQFNELTDTEKYFFLLETFWVDIDWNEINIWNRYETFPMATVPRLLSFLSMRKPGEKIPIDVNSIPNKISYLIKWGYFLVYFSFFGFWEVIPAENPPRLFSNRKGFWGKYLIPTRFGITISPILNRERNIFLWNIPLRKRIFHELDPKPGFPIEGSSSSGFEFFIYLVREVMDPNIISKASKKASRVSRMFFEPFSSLFPKDELNRGLPREKVKFEDGTYIFKVSLNKDVYRRIAISATDTLFELHSAINSSFDFDFDHLYSFFMDNKVWSINKFTAIEESEGPHVDEVLIGELGLKPGQRFIYLYDYGDNWEFSVKLEDIIKDRPKPERPEIIESKGKISQYQYEEDGDYTPDEGE